MAAPSEPAAAPPPGQRVAVVGSGVAGLVAAWRLDAVHDVTVFEAEDYPGGHTHTVTLERGPDAGTPVDTGFIVMNLRNYPVLSRVLDRLGVELRDSTMTFGFHDERTGFQYAGTGPAGLFAQPANLVRPSFHRLLADVVRFGRRAKRDLAAGALADRALGEYVAGLGLSGRFRRDYLEPMGAAIWSAPPGAVADFPAEAFLRFFENHGLLTLTDLPQWKTRRRRQPHLRAAHARRLPRARCGCARRCDRCAGPATRSRSWPGPPGAERFDHVVVATHADQALRLLADPSDDERRLLGRLALLAQPHRAAHRHARAAAAPGGVGGVELRARGGRRDRRRGLGHLRHEHPAGPAHARALPASPSTAAVRWTRPASWPR